MNFLQICLNILRRLFERVECLNDIFLSFVKSAMKENNILYSSYFYSVVLISCFKVLLSYICIDHSENFQCREVKREKIKSFRTKFTVKTQSLTQVNLHDIQKNRKDIFEEAIDDKNILALSSGSRTYVFKILLNLSTFSSQSDFSFHEDHNVKENSQVQKRLTYISCKRDCLNPQQTRTSLQFNTKEQRMTIIDCTRLESLILACIKKEQLFQHFHLFEKKYKTRFHYDLTDILSKSAEKINKRDHFLIEKSSNNLVIYERPQYFQRGQLQIFCWTVAAYCKKMTLSLEQMDENNCQDIRSIFIGKSLIFIKYEILCLAFDRTKNPRQWQQEQKLILTDIMKQYEETLLKKQSSEKNQQANWSVISYRLFLQSQCQYYRSSLQCKQKWLNHLSPDVKHEPWSLTETIQLLEGVELLGKKWSQLYAYFKGKRTEHMIKNRYDSVVKYWKRKTSKKLEKQWIEKAIEYFSIKVSNNEDVDSISHSSCEVGMIDSPSQQGGSRGSSAQKNQQKQLRTKETLEQTKRSLLTEKSSRSFQPYFNTSLKILEEKFQSQEKSSILKLPFLQIEEPSIITNNKQLKQKKQTYEIYDERYYQDYNFPPLDRLLDSFFDM